MKMGANIANLYIFPFDRMNEKTQPDIPKMNNEII